MKIDNRILLIYYLSLLGVMLSWTDTENAPNIILRVVFMVASVVPAVIYDKAYLAPVVICFNAITQNGFAHSYMPDNQLYYIALLSLSLLLFRPAKEHVKVPSFIWAIFFYIIIIDIVTNFIIEKITLTFIVAWLLFQFTTTKSERDVRLWSLSFIITSLVLSSEFLLNRQRFAELYFGIGLERSYWMDPNYFGMVIGMGFIVALLYVLKHSSKTLSKLSALAVMLLCIITMITSIIVLILNASRGALLAVSIASIMALSLSKVKKSYKMALIILMMSCLYLLYQDSYFDLLQYRIENDDTEGANGRYEIWEKKINLFFEGSPLNVIFGNGQDGGLKLGYGNIKRGTHNDYIGFLVEYGIIGMFLFITMLFKPLLKALKNMVFPTVVVLSTYLGICCFTLEPITGAYIPFLFFYYYIVLIAYSVKKNMTLLV